jgi:hypothetical protein
VRCVLVLAVFALGACRPPGYGKEDIEPDAAPDGSTQATVDAPVDGAAGLTCDHAFRVDGQATASSVWLTGSMVSWAGNPGAGAVALVQGNDGAWSGTYAFEPGTHQYKFIVDGTNWILDPTNQNTASDGQGNTNSVYTCVP